VCGGRGEQRTAPREEAPAALDPASLPPSIGARDEGDEAPAEEARPRRRARRTRSAGDDEAVEAFGCAVDGSTAGQLLG
jgi:hypothetical protein